MVKVPSAKVYSKSVSVSYPGQSLKCVKVTTLGPRTLLPPKLRENVPVYKHSYCRCRISMKPNVQKAITTFSDPTILGQGRFLTCLIVLSRVFYYNALRTLFEALLQRTEGKPRAFAALINGTQIAM